MEEQPDYLSPEWHDYVMSLFTSNELVEGNPTVAGLRRVAELVLGPIDFSGPTQVFPVDGNGPGRSTVLYMVKFCGWMNSISERTYTEVADVWTGNTDSTYVAYAPAMAATRAEGRCLRKALKLRAVSAEELTTQDTAKAVAEGSTDMITTDQINFIDTKCKKLNLNVDKLIVKYGDFGGIYDVNKETGARIIKDLTSWTNKKELIESELLGYENWR